MKRRKIIAAIVLLGGVALFFIIIGASPSSSRPLIVAEAGKGTDYSLAYAASANRGLSSGGSTSASGTVVGTSNMTDALIQNYTQNILQINNGFSSAIPNATNTISFPSADAMSNQLASSLAQTLPSKIFTMQDIAVESDNSTSSELAYLQAFSALSNKNFANLKVSLGEIIDQFISNNDPTLLNQYIAVINNEINGLLAIPVPSQMAAWHLENLNLWEEKLTVFTAILNTQTDPLQASIALNEIDGLVGKTQTLQSVINAKVKSLTAS